MGAFKPVPPHQPVRVSADHSSDLLDIAALKGPEYPSLLAPEAIGHGARRFIDQSGEGTDIFIRPFQSLRHPSGHRPADKETAHVIPYCGRIAHCGCGKPYRL